MFSPKMETIQGTQIFWAVHGEIGGYSLLPYSAVLNWFPTVYAFLGGILPLWLGYILHRRCFVYYRRAVLVLHVTQRLRPASFLARCNFTGGYSEGPPTHARKYWIVRPSRSVQRPGVLSVLHPEFFPSYFAGM